MYLRTNLGCRFIELLEHSQVMSNALRAVHRHSSLHSNTTAYAPGKQESSSAERQAKIMAGSLQTNSVTFQESYTADESEYEATKVRDERETREFIEQIILTGNYTREGVPRESPVVGS